VRASLLELEQECHEWLSDYYELNGLTTTPSSDSPASAESPSDPECTEPQGRALKYRSVLEASYHSLYWVCILLIREALLDLSSRRTDTASGKQRSYYAVIDQCADLLCESIPYLSEAADATVLRAMVVRAPLHFASRWFLRTGNMEKLDWCQAVEKRIRSDAPFLQWDALLPWSFFSILWLAP
jgi:hypothetical protein